MKIHSFLALLAVWSAIGLCQAQGTLQFHATVTGAGEIPPNSSPFVANGEFWLDGDSLWYLVSMHNNYFFPTASWIEGPAAPGQKGDVLFSLGPYGITAPDPKRGCGGGVGTSGGLSLTKEQQADLQAGLWHVDIASPEYPNGQIRGQILLVPEPPVWALLGLGAAALLLRCRPRA